MPEDEARDITTEIQCEIEETAEKPKYPLARRLGDGERPMRRRIVLEEIKDGVMSLTPFAPEDVLHTVTCDTGTVFEYTVQDMLDEVGRRRIDDDLQDALRADARRDLLEEAKKAKVYHREPEF